MKRYITPTYEVVRINKNDVIATSIQSVESNASFSFGGGSTDAARAAERGFYEDVIYLGY